MCHTKEGRKEKNKIMEFRVLWLLIYALLSSHHVYNRDLSRVLFYVLLYCCELM